MAGVSGFAGTSRKVSSNQSLLGACPKARVTLPGTTFTPPSLSRPMGPAVASRLQADGISQSKCTPDIPSPPSLPPAVPRSLTPSLASQPRSLPHRVSQHPAPWRGCLVRGQELVVYHLLHFCLGVPVFWGVRRPRSLGPRKELRLLLPWEWYWLSRSAFLPQFPSTWYRC